MGWEGAECCGVMNSPFFSWGFPGFGTASPSTLEHPQSWKNWDDCHFKWWGLRTETFCWISNPWPNFISSSKDLANIFSSQHYCLTCSGFSLLLLKTICLKCYSHLCQPPKLWAHLSSPKTLYADFAWEQMPLPHPKSRVSLPHTSCSLCDPTPCLLGASWASCGPQTHHILGAILTSVVQFSLPHPRLPFPVWSKPICFLSFPDSS